MKVGILTLPLYCNYGGIMQCYALQTILQRMGHETVILQREFARKYTFLGACIYYTKHMIKLLIGRRSSWHYYVSQEKRDYIAQNTIKFIIKHINPRSERCLTTQELKKEVRKYKLDAIIVGSDQVWRPSYSPSILNYFLDFLEEDHRIRKISYGASFGCEDWTFTRQQTIECSKLLKTFNAISVREESAIKLCKEHFGVNAIQVLDPTMLLHKEDYIKLISSNKKKRGGLFCYVLDRNKEKQRIINFIANATQLVSFESMPELEEDTFNLYSDINKCIYPPIEDWLSAFNEAEMVMTDSFHGTVFSIIFNKPFWVVGNEGRGITRFKNILSLFGLEGRMITNNSLSSINIHETIDWTKVNKRRNELICHSIGFLRSAI